MNYQILNKTDKDVRFAGQTVPAKSSVCIHASFVSAEDLKNVTLKGNIVYFEEELPKKTRGRTKKEDNK